MRLTRPLSLTPDLVALCARPEPEYPDTIPGTLLDDGGFADHAERLSAECGDGPLWVFAYGSLIWKPAFEAVERRRSTAYGWHRSFCLEIRSWRGSPTQPGLMMALDRGGRCDGVVYRLPDADRHAQIEAMLRREVSAEENLSAIRWLPVRTGEGPVRALTFWAGPRGDYVKRGLPHRDVASILANACGHVGSGAEYLYNTVLHLEAFGIRDRNLWHLQELVAEQLRQRVGGSS